MLRPLSVAVAQPDLVDGDVAATAEAHADLVRSSGARLVVFPELSLTGYDLDAPAVALDAAAWRPLLVACAEVGATALVGAPTAGEDGGRRISVVAVVATGVRVAYEKVHLGADEAARFVPGRGPAVIEVDGWRVGLAVCRDTGVPEHAEAAAALGVDLVAAGLVEEPEAVPVLHARAERIAAACGAPVAFAVAAGAPGPRHGYPRGAGRSFVRGVDGRTLATAGDRTGDVVTAELRP